MGFQPTKLPFYQTQAASEEKVLEAPFTDQAHDLRCKHDIRTLTEQVKISMDFIMSIESEVLHHNQI